ncbi:hypothetical protein [Streptococcus parauberis]|uniref:hypothetical protein n=1 Tax=Streptococcus parauberis TaxID=1348 RepID=UPI000E308049|nr:hypothetical protein [Streptococcus parauberis]RFE00763.1 hypothetical protein ADO06_01636 [Streptococcus parauberis]
MDILAVLLFGLFIYFVVFSPIRDIKNKVNFENARGAYTISFYKLEKKIDIRDNNINMENVKIIFPREKENRYTVESKLNDVELRKLLMQEFNLTKGQVVVTRN